MVKCILCGAVFPADRTVCPVCGAGPEQFVAADAARVAFRRDTRERFLILGGGIAGLSAAEAIRARNATCQVVLVTEEDAPPYNRPMLTKALGTDYAALAVHDDAWYRERDILVVTGRRVTALDASARQAELEGGMRLQYDACVIALGARCFIPPIAGTELPGVVAIRGVADARAVDGLVAAGAKRAVVIGGGVLGLEAAWALKRMGLDVTVLEHSDRLMARQLDEEASGLLLDIAGAKGVHIRTGVSAEAIIGEGRVRAVRLAGGETLPADIVLIASGVRPNIDVARAAGATADRGVVTDDRMETSLPRVYACGDCAQVGGVCAGIWPVAVETGRVAGANAAGEDVRYAPVSLAITFQGMGTALYANGDVGRDPAKQYRVEALRDELARTLEKRYFDGDRLCGVILLGDIGKAAAHEGLR